MPIAPLLRAAALSLPLSLNSASAFAQDALVLRGSQLVKEGKPAAALELLRTARDANASSPEYHYVLGIAALDTGDLDLAIESLGRAVALKPDSAPAHAELGRAYLLTGNLLMAHLSMQRARALKPPPEALASMDRYVDDFHRVMEARVKRLGGSLSVGVGHDSNVNTATAAQSVTLPIFGGLQATIGPQGRARDDGFTVLAAELAGFHPLGERLQVIGGAGASAKLNANEKAFDNENLTGAIGLRFNADAVNQLNVLANAETFSLDNRRLRDTAGVSGEWRRMAHPLVDAGVFVQLARLSYPQENFRDVNRSVYGLSLTPAAFGRRLFTAPPMLSAYGGGERTVQEGVPHLAHRLWGLRLGDVHYFTSRLSSFQGLGYESRRHRGADPLFLALREDHQMDLTLGLQYRLSADFTLVPTVTHTENRSNIDVFKYRRTTASVVLRYAF